MRTPSLPGALVSARKERAFAALAILNDRQFRAIESFQLPPIENDTHLSIGNARALPQQDRAVSAAHGLVGIMSGEQHAAARGAKRADLLHHPPLIPEIQARGW